MEKTYNIQQVSKITGLSAHTLRYYEKIGLLDEVSRDEKGYRQYRESDLSWLNFLIRLRVTEMPIHKMKQFSDLRSQGDSTIAARRELLEDHRENVIEQMQQMQKYLGNIEDKISHYKKLERDR